MINNQTKILLNQDYLSVLTEMSKAYTSLLMSINVKDETLMFGLKEGLNKFLSNAYLKLVPGKNKYCKSHFVSPMALELLNSNDKVKGLIFEHMVPKTKYIQEECMRLAIEGQLTEEFVFNKLKDYWWLATITKKEDGLLDKNNMPKNWNKVDIKSRYEIGGVDLTLNPFFYEK